jgi:hypothetical protein
LETEFRGIGLTLVFMDKVAPPLVKGSRREVAGLIADILDYDQAGKFRHDLAQKMIASQIALARAGFSTGGRPPYGFRRWLVQVDGTRVRELAAGEYVRRAGHHVAWLPTAEDELAVSRRILIMLETKPATRVAAILTSENVPSPDLGRQRTDRGVKHSTSGVWHQTTVVNIARNPLIGAVVSYGRRSMGDQLRFTPEGPRELRDADYRKDGKPKVVANPPDVRVEAPARFEPLVDLERHQQLLTTLDQRAGTQRGKARSRDPHQNPLGGRVYDMACGWPLYRQPYNGSFRYLCGLYQQSHGEKCCHNHVAGPSATMFLLNSIRQRVLAPGKRGRLEEKLLKLAEADVGNTDVGILEVKQVALRELDRKLERAAENMALASGESQLRAMESVHRRLSGDRETILAEIRAAERTVGRKSDADVEVTAALQVLDQLGALASDPSNMPAVGELFQRLNARMFLRFHEETWGRRQVNRVTGGVVTFGVAPSPVPLYQGPTSRRQIKQIEPIETASFGAATTNEPSLSALEGGSLGNVSRGERI